MFRPARPALLAGSLAGALALLLASPAAHARIGLGVGYPQRTNTERTVAPATAGDITVVNAGINRADCYDPEQHWKFLFTSVPAGATTVEIWARADNSSCADRAQRLGTATTPYCYKVASFNRQDVALQQIVTIRPIQMIHAINKLANVENADIAGLDPEVSCKPSSAGMIPRNIFLHILPMSGQDVVADTTPVVPGTGTGTTAGTDAVFQTIWDIDGPTPPAGLSAGAGNTLLVLNFGNTAQTISDHNGFRAYCFPGSPTAPATKELDGALEASDDANTGADTGPATDDASSTADGATSDDASTPTDPGARPAGCPTGDPFVVGEPPTAEMEKYACGASGTTTGTSLTVSGLKNYVPYTIVVGAVDKQGNAGALSEAVCGMPKETVDFWSAYKNAGGAGGGGICAFGYGRSAASALAAGAFGLALLARLGRRIRKPL